MSRDDILCQRGGRRILPKIANVFKTKSRSRHSDDVAVSSSVALITPSSIPSSARFHVVYYITLTLDLSLQTRCPKIRYQVIELDKFGAKPNEPVGITSSPHSSTSLNSFGFLFKFYFILILESPLL